MNVMSKDIKKNKIKIWGVPTGAILWPSALSALIFGIVGNLYENLPLSTTMLFIIIFSLNLLILFFDFSRGAVMGISGLVFGIFGILYGLNVSVDLTEFINSGVVGGAPNEFFIVYGAVFLILLFFAIIFRRSFEYFEFEANELLKKHGILGDSQRFSAPNIRIKKHINDVFESILLFGAGDMVLITSDNQEFHIKNVMRINRAEKRIRQNLSKLDVEVKSDK